MTALEGDFRRIWAARYVEPRRYAVRVAARLLGSLILALREQTGLAIFRRQASRMNCACTRHRQKRWNTKSKAAPRHRPTTAKP